MLNVVLLEHFFHRLFLHTVETVFVSLVHVSKAFTLHSKLTRTRFQTFSFDQMEHEVKCVVGHLNAQPCEYRAPRPPLTHIAHKHKYTLIYDATLGVSQSQESISDLLNLEVLSTNKVPIQCFIVSLKFEQSQNRASQLGRSLHLRMTLVGLKYP